MEYNPLNSNIRLATDIPLTYVGPELAGQTVYVSLFDTDSGAQPPIVFYLDTVAESDWSLTFGEGDPDPDGVSGHCLPGSCNNLWVAPPYQIQIPDLTTDCDPADPDPQVCTPFNGGRLMARYSSGYGDSYAWQVSSSGEPTSIDLHNVGAGTGAMAVPVGVTAVLLLTSLGTMVMWKKRGR